MWTMQNNPCDILNLRIVSYAASGAAGATSKAVTVPDGEGWIILGGHLLHNDDAGAHSLYWSVTPLDGAAEMIITEPESKAQNVRSQLYSNFPGPMPIVLHSGDIITAYVDAIAAGHIVTMSLLIAKRIGEAP